MMFRHFVIVCLFAALSARAEPILVAARPFADQMVLPMGRETPVWGVAAPGAEVALRFGTRTARGKADMQGNWRLALTDLTASAEGRELVIVSGNDRLILPGETDVSQSAAGISGALGTATILNQGTLTFSGTRSGEFNASESTLPDGWEITYHNDLGEVRLSAIAPPGGYLSWIASYETGGTDGFGEDADNDGIANGLEFVLHGGDPLTPRSAVLPAINAAAPGEPRFTFLRAACARGHASIMVELSDDLTNWPENRRLAVGETTATPGPGVEVVPHEVYDEITVALPQGAPRTFVRIRVIERISGIEE